MASIAPHNNAPYAVSQPPFPNVVVPFNRRLECHVINLTGANGSVTYNAAASTGGTNVTYVSEGIYELTFPAGGVGAIGWFSASFVASDTADVTIPRVFTFDTNATTTPFVLGVARVQSFDLAATPALNDVIGTVTIQVWVLKDFTD